MSKQAGFNGRMFLGAEGGGSAAATEVKFARDVTLTLNGEPIDITSRDTAPWKDFIAGLRQWSVNFNAIYENTDAALDALGVAFIAGTAISVRLVDGDGDGYYGDCIVSDFSNEQPLGDTMSRTVVLQGKGAPTVVDIAS